MVKVTVELNESQNDQLRHMMIRDKIISKAAYLEAIITDYLEFEKNAPVNTKQLTIEEAFKNDMD